jgi:hypothetical protein
MQSLTLLRKKKGLNNFLLRLVKLGWLARIFFFNDIIVVSNFVETNIISFDYSPSLPCHTCQERKLAMCSS